MGFHGGYRFGTTKENSVEDGSSKVGYVALVDNEPKALCEAKSPSVMKKAGPLRGIELKSVRGQFLVPKIITMVSTLFPVGYNVSFKICVGRIVSASETNVMFVSYLSLLSAVL
jgi:hypothetical protein